MQSRVHTFCCSPVLLRRRVLSSDLPLQGTWVHSSNSHTLCCLCAPLLTQTSQNCLNRTCFPEFFRWGCREHFFSGRWHSPGRDYGRYPRECRLFTLGVLHPGVPVMWQTHIPQLKAVRGAAYPQGNKLPWLIVSTGDGL